MLSAVAAAILVLQLDPSKCFAGNSVRHEARTSVYNRYVLGRNSSLQAPGRGSKPSPRPAPASRPGPKPTPTTPPAPTPPPPAAPPKDGLSADRTAFAALGASLRLPPKASVTRLADEEFPAWRVDSGDPDGPVWRLRVEQVWAADPKADCAMQAKGALRALGAGGTEVKVLAEQAGTLAGCESRTVWATATRGESITLAGWLLVRTGDGIFFSVAVAATPKDFAGLQALLDASFSTLQLTDPRVAQAEREAAIERGSALLTSLGGDRLKALADGTSQVRRLWRQDAEGAEEEIGWVEVRVVHGPRNRAGRAGPSLMKSPDEQEDGLLVSLIARTMNADGTDRVETRASYWLAWDLGSEAWSSRSDQKGAGPQRRFEQVGMLPRAGGSSGLPTLMVATDTGTGMEEPQTWTRPPTAYLPQALSLLLGRLLPRDGSAPSDMAFYAFDPASGRLCQRLVHWAKDPAAPGQWCLSVRNTPDTPPAMEWYDEQGRFLRRREADGSCMDPSTPADIQRRWRALGLDP